jgi:hypothetical protein
MPPSGIHIVGKSGTNEKVILSTANNLCLWQKACLLSTAQDVAHFMSKWGQLSKWLTDDGSRAYSESFLLIEPNLQGLKFLAGFVERDDKIGFCRGLKDSVLISRADIVIDADSSELPLVIEAPSLLRFMLLEMWNEFGGERAAQTGIRACGYCNKTFHVGGRRGKSSRRMDALYCSDSCKNMASRERSANRHRG